MRNEIDSVQLLEQLMTSFSEDHSVPFEHMVLGGGCALMICGMRKDTRDINLWVEEDHFRRLAAERKVIVHPMTDVAFMIEHMSIQVWVRKYNPYFKFDTYGKLNVYKPIGLITQKRGGLLQVSRPQVKRDQDRIDLIKLDEQYRETHKVSA